MLTIFATPRPFRGHIGVIQTNAIQSWVQLRPSCEIILFGDEEGTAEVAAEFGIQHIPDIECNEYGTPLLGSIFGLAQNAAAYQLMCYVNADIILMSDFLEAICKIQRQSFLLVGRRWDIDLKEPLNFKDPSWEEQLRDRLAKEGKLHGRSGLDYFVFPRGVYRDIPPFAIGRTAWDNWLLYKARSLGLPAIDATRVVSAVHQNHGYAQQPAQEEEAVQRVWKGIEAQRNLELLGSKHYSFNLWDATHLLTPDGLKSAMSIRHLLWRLLRLPETHPRLTPLVEIIRGSRSIAYRSAALRRGRKKYNLKQKV